MKVLFVYPEAKGGITSYSLNVIDSIFKYYKDVEIVKCNYDESNMHNLADYIARNRSIVKQAKDYNFDLVHIEFDYGYYGFSYGGKGAIDLLERLKNNNIVYTISVHNEPQIFVEGMKVLGKDSTPFNKITALVQKIPYSRKIVHNPLILGTYASLLPLDLKQNLTHNDNLYNKDNLVIGLFGYIHRAKGYHEFLKFVVENEDLFKDIGITVKCLFLKRLDRTSKDRIEYEKELQAIASKSKFIDMNIIPVDPESYLEFINNIDVGLVSLNTMTQSGSITELISKNKPVISREHKNIAYLDFIIQYRNEDMLYYIIANLRKLLKDYNFEKQKDYIIMSSPYSVAFAYRNCFVRNVLPKLKYRKAIGAIIKYKNKHVMIKKWKIPFYDILHGGIEKGETTKEALFREVNEELNITPKDIEKVKFIGHFKYFKPIGMQIKNRSKGTDALVYELEINRLPNLPTDEMESWQYYTPKLKIYTSTKQFLDSVGL